MSTIEPVRRNDIQSLRALAITLVVASHAQIFGFQGGFVGVDVFFVLSGYLISALILSELEVTGKFNFWRFYANRFKRLLPALLLMLVITSGIAYFFIDPWSQMRDATTAQLASVWLSNFYFASRSIDYFSAGLDRYSYLHTWSLAIEEQFYIVWPWIIMFLLAVWSWQGSMISRKRLSVGLAFIFFLSLVGCAVLSQSSPEAAFYLMPSRAWEFALGAMVMLVGKDCAEGRAPMLDRLRGRSILNVTGIACMLIATACYSKALHYPGLWALLPCVGASLFLLDAPERTSTSRLSRLLCQQPAILFLGDISYSLYLWHWPILKFGEDIFEASIAIRMGLVVLALLLAIAAYKWVEHPVHRLSDCRPAPVWFASLFGICLGVFYFGDWQMAADRLTQTPVQRNIQVAKLDVSEIYQGNCDSWFHSSELSVCRYGVHKAAKTVLLFGDSVGVQWFQAIKKEYVEALGWQLVVLTKSSCPAEQLSYYYPRIKSTYTVCDEWREKAINYIQTLRPDLVIMGSSHYGFSEEELANGVRITLGQISPRSAAVALIVPPPQLGFDGLACLAKQSNWPSWLPQTDDCLTVLNRERQGGMKESLRKGAAPFKNVAIVDVDHLVCPDGVCRAMLKDIIVFRDALHLTNRYVDSISTSFAQIVNVAISASIDESRK